MSEINQLLKDIEILRAKLHEIINDKKYNLQDPEVLAASRMLNASINKYNEILARIREKGS